MPKISSAQVRRLCHAFIEDATEASTFSDQVTETPQHGLTETGEDTGALASSHLAALVAQQSGDEPDHGAGQAEADTIDGHVGPFDEAIP